jgi:hypothetical protein
MAVSDRIRERARAYAEREAALAAAVTASRFADFHESQHLLCRIAQDLVWAATEIPSGRLAEPARELRAALTARLRRILRALSGAGPSSPTIEGAFRFDLRMLRAQMARILARLTEGTDADRWVVLAALAAALEAHAFGVPVPPEPGVPERVAAAVPGIENSDAPRFLELVDLVFDALTNVNGRDTVPGSIPWTRALTTASDPGRRA